jgi:hypothetical protein
MTTTEDHDEEQAFDPASRRLCSDDACTGLIGPDGRCKVCGAASPDGPPPVSAGGTAPDPLAEPPEDARAAGSDGGDADFDPEERVLCPDDTCTGLVGSDGRCKVCGKPREP